MAGTRVRTVLVAARPLVRAGLQAQLAADPAVELVAVASSPDDLLVDIPAPDAVVLDSEDGADAVEARWPGVRVVVHQASAPAGATRQAALTERELEVLVQVASGLSNRRIAQELGISEHTVKSHLGWVMRKLEAGSRAGAVHGALVQGLL